MPRLLVRLSKRPTNSRITSPWSPIRHGKERFSAKQRRNKSQIGNYSRPMTAKARTKHSSTRGNSQPRVFLPSASRGKRLPMVNTSRAHPRFRRVFLNVSSMMELRSWVKTHRNPGILLPMNASNLLLVFFFFFNSR